ncbi:M23 family metallopeptidase [Bacteroidales bacterium OttesenSCG-928-K03]|nr:M23 family metallopeptidase [Odoribacter sp. OttesenSCG-928-L07]MDL2240476.1 M23 family metallopeptidase [Bacteroidales bacterium OttesenSCG-928-K22]MDL2242286.1 M23 family metallopeptidase [Bacteroidales bacterium OttesenSCG-928-K03]
MTYTAKHKILKYLIVFIFLSFTKIDCLAQEFMPPMRGVMYLSGSFAELRDGHFHSGIDIKTGGTIGKNVYAIADGYVSRIAVSPGGFGKALYIVHPNGYTSVYAHLDHFNKDIDKYVKDYQYSKKSFEVNIFLSTETFPVKQGDLIAISGNSGSSGGPHLHFEIRSTSDEKPLNPLLFNFPVKDWTRPKVTHLNIYPYDESAFINGENKIFNCEIAGWGEGYRLAKKDTISIKGSVYLGIGTHDAMNDINNKNGIYSIDCTIDNDTIYSFVADGFLFSETRYINSIIDYPTYIDKKYRVYKTYFEPNNKLKMLRYIKNNGLIELEDNEYHTVKFIIKDTYLNTSILTFTLVNDDKSYEIIPTNSFDYNFIYNQNNEIIFDDFKLEISAGKLFDNIKFNFSKEYIDIKNIYSNVYYVGDRTITSFSPFKISIKIDNEISDDIKPRLYMATQNSKGDWVYCSNNNSNGWITTNTRNFGNFALFCDITPPTITCKSLNKDSETNISQSKEIKVTIIDKESGICSYTPTLNNEWILMDYDAKNNLLTYSFDNKLRKGKNIFKLVVKDNCGNISEIERKLIY